MAYLIIIFFLLLIAVYNYKGVDNRKIVVLTLVVSALLMAFRDKCVGADTIAYSEIFDIANQTDWRDILKSDTFCGVEVAYVVLMKLVGYVCRDYYFFQLIYSVIFTSLFSSLILKSHDPFLAITIYFGSCIYLLSFNIQRQLLAVAIIIYAWSFFLKGDWYKFFAFFLLAFSFHYTAIVGFIPFLLYIIGNKYNIYQFMPFVALALILNYEFVVDFAVDNVSKYGNYYSNERGFLKAGGVQVLWLFYAVLSLFVIYKSEYFEKLEQIAAIATLIMISTSVIGLKFNYFDRLGAYFLPYVIILVLSIKRFLDDRNQGKTFYVITVSFFIFFFWLSTQSRQYCYTSFL